MCAKKVQTSQGEKNFYRDRLHKIDGQKETILRLRGENQPELLELKNQCSERDLRLGQVQIDDLCVFGVFADGKLVSVACEKYSFFKNRPQAPVEELANFGGFEVESL